MTTNSRKVAIVGAGPGGLTAGMLLTHRGLDVTVFEKEAVVGGRNASFVMDNTIFDIGPTFLMMKFLLDEVFEESGYSSDDFLKFTKLEPMYRLDFPFGFVDVSNNGEKLTEDLRRLFPGTAIHYDKFMRDEKKRYEALYPCLQKDYSRLGMMFNSDLIKALPRLDIGKSLYSALSRYFGDQSSRIAFSFQSKYLGMSPWTCPAVFTMIPYIEHAQGIYHVEGGLSEISRAMAEAFSRNGGTLLTSTPVESLVVGDGRVRGVRTGNGDIYEADHVIINADFAHAMTHIVPDEHRGRYSRDKLLQKSYSCSTFMMYLCLDTVLPLEHHTIVFADDYRKNVDDITEGRIPYGNSSFYVRNSARTDTTVAPDGRSGLYILVPVPNNKSGADWNEEGPRIREWVIQAMKTRLGIDDIEAHILSERIITPHDWEQSFNVFLGATFNLAHSLDQLLWFRPHNTFDHIPGCYLVGGGTHPGSGLPTIYESGRITARSLCTRLGIPY